jgi:RHS repeat-associated protein
VHDLHGNIAALLPFGKEEPTFFRYSAFGEQTVFGTIVSPWTFSSKRSDDRNGLVYYGRRFYIPVLGRWLTPDPSGFTDGMNLYAFVDNNPLIYFDEYGLFTEPYIPPMQFQFSWNKNMIKPRTVSFMDGRGLSPSGNVSPHYLLSGIWNNTKDSDHNGWALRGTIGNSPGVTAVTPHSRGWFGIGDLVSLIPAAFGSNYKSNASEYLERNLKWDCLVLKILNDPRKIFITAFSRGTADVYHAVKNLSREEKDRLIITGCGGIVMLPRDLGYKVTNLFAEKDAYSLAFHRGLRKNAHKFDSVADVHLLPQPSGFFRNFSSHAFANDTYQQGIKRYTVPDYDKFGRSPK